MAGLVVEALRVEEGLQVLRGDLDLLGLRLGAGQVGGEVHGAREATNGQLLEGRALDEQALLRPAVLLDGNIEQGEERAGLALARAVGVETQRLHLEVGRGHELLHALGNEISVDTLVEPGVVFLGE